jgi:hypothetical protein
MQVLTQPVGRVVRFNPQARFVVVDFSFHTLPAAQTRLGVYRDNERIGTVRVTGTPRGSLVAADIVEGEAAPRDEIRD